MTQSFPSSSLATHARFAVVVAFGLFSVAVSAGALASAKDGKNVADTKAAVESVESEKDTAADNLQGQKPYASFTRLRHDFGDITRGQKVSFAFEFQNTGSGVLQIRSIHAACGCVNTRIEPKDVFQPGEKGKISFEFDSSYFSGQIVRTLTLDTNQTRNSTQTLTFTANVREEIRSVPALLGVGEILPEYNKAWLIQLPTALRAAGNEPESVPPGAEKAGLPSGIISQFKDSSEVKPLFVTSSHPAIAAEIVPPATKGSDYQLKVTFKGNLPIGPLREKVTVWNSSRYLKELIVPIYGDVVGHVKQSAKYVEFGVVTRPDAVRRTLTFSSDRKDFVVESVSAELRRTDALEGVSIADILKYSSIRNGEATQVNFELRYPEALTTSFLPVNASGVFIVKTNDPDYKEVKVPFFGVLRQENKR
ncbi:MAG: hypothetical protein RL189_2079 [Pseudomonadota bacterium]|jgi:hypothetical protein